MDVTGKTADEVKELIAAGVKDYELSLLLRGNGRETIKGTDIGLYTVFDGSLEEIIRQQNPYAWPRYLLKGPSYELKTMISFDEEGLSKTLKCWAATGQPQYGQITRLWQLPGMLETVM